MDAMLPDFPFKIENSPNSFGTKGVVEKEAEANLVFEHLLSYGCKCLL